MSAQGQLERAKLFAQQPQYQPQPQQQYQQPQYQVSQTQQSTQYQQAPAVQPLQPQYQASQTQQATQYQAAPAVQPLHGQASNEDGQYVSNDDEGKYVPGKDEEPQGPPKGFFYSFDYPVGIIVSDQGRAGLHPQQKREGDIHQIYSENKHAFEKQLQAGAGVGQQYSYVKH